MQDQALKDNVAIVTGAGRGIGRSIALSLASQGAHVVLAARSEHDLNTVKAQIEDLGGRALVMPTDLRSEQEIIRLVDVTISTFARLDILINNAGVGVFGPLVTATADDWEEVMSVNVRGTFLMCREAIPYMKRQQISYIVNINSAVGVKGYANQALYAASKHAVMGLSKSLAKEVQGDGIRVHAICPGGVDTDMIFQARPDLEPSTLMQPHEIADIVLFIVTRKGNAVIDFVNVRRSASAAWS